MTSERDWYAEVTAASLAEDGTMQKLKIAWANRLHAAEQRAESAEVMLKEARLNEHALQSQVDALHEGSKKLQEKFDRAAKDRYELQCAAIDASKIGKERDAAFRERHPKLAEAPALFGFAVEPEAPDLAYLKVQVDAQSRDYIGLSTDVQNLEAARIVCEKEIVALKAHVAEVTIMYGEMLKRLDAHIDRHPDLMQRITRLEEVAVSAGTRLDIIKSDTDKTLNRLTVIEALPAYRNVLQCEKCCTKTIYWTARMGSHWKCIECNEVQLTVGAK